MRPAGSGFLATSGAALGYGRWLRPQRPRRRALWRRPYRQSGCLEFLSQRSLAAGCTLPMRAEGCHHEKLSKHTHARHCPGAQRMPLDPLRTVGAVQVGAAIGAEVVACLYVDHLASAHGALLFLASSHPPCSGIRSILLMPAGTVPAAAATLLVCAPAPELPHAGIASQMRPARSRPPEPHEPGLDAYRSLTGRARGSSGCMGQDGVPGRQGSRPPMPFPLSLRSRRLCLPV